jgi:hypothetical protein
MLHRAPFSCFKALLLMSLFSTSMPLFSQTCASNRDAWDWTVPVSQTVYLNDSGVIARAVNLPYYAFDGFATNLNDPSGPDVLPANGWVLLFRSFGNPACGTNMPYFILYNRYHGLLRVFFYNHLTSQTFSFGQVNLDETNTSDASLLNFDGGDLNHSLITVDQIGPDQWSYADFKLTTYDPNSHTDATLNFNVNGITSTSLTLTGGISLNQVEGEAQVAGLFNKTNSAINAFNTDFKTVATAAKTLNDEANHNSTTWWAQAIHVITNNGSAFAAGDIWGALGFVKSFLGGGQTKAPPMHFQGQIQATGTLQTTGQVYQFILRVPGQPHSNPNDLSLPLYDTKLGVFNPTIPDVNRYEQVGDCGTDILCIYNNPKVYESATPLSIQLNPNILTDATVTVAAGFTFAGSAPVFTNQTQATSANVSLDMSSQSMDDPQEIAIKITIQPNSAPPGQEPITIMKTYFVYVTDAGFR